MVAILVFDASKNVPIKLLDEGNLLVNLNLLQRLLNNPAPIHLKGQLQDIPSCLGGQDIPLLLGAWNKKEKRRKKKKKKTRKGKKLSKNQRGENKKQTSEK